jgi:hypothetical protein
MSITSSSSGDDRKIARSSSACTGSPQSVGGPRAGETGGGFERFTEVCQGLISRGRSHPGLLLLANLRFEVSRLLPAFSYEPDVATTPRALQRKLLAHPGHENAVFSASHNPASLDRSAARPAEA